MLPAGGLGVSPSFKKSPKTGGYRGLIIAISAFSDDVADKASHRFGVIYITSTNEAWQYMDSYMHSPVHSY